MLRRRIRRRRVSGRWGCRLEDPHQHGGHERHDQNEASGRKMPLAASGAGLLERLVTQSEDRSARIVKRLLQVDAGIGDSVQAPLAVLGQTFTQ